MPFELLQGNYINTSTQLTVNDNTATAVNVLNRDIRFQYSSGQFADDNTTVTMTIAFDQTLTVDRVALVGHNLKSYTVFYDGVTANTFAVTSTSDTSATDFISNSSVSQYFRVAPVDVTSVTIDMKATIVADNNKALGFLVLSEKLTDFDGRKPIAQTYNPRLNPTDVTHRLSDGGIRIQTVDDKWDASFFLDFVTESTRDSLRSIFDDHNDLVFCPFGTSTGWDETIFPCVWGGSFDFYTHSDNASEAGFSGRIGLNETPL
jgi:hypothetical protein